MSSLSLTDFYIECAFVSDQFQIYSVTIFLLRLHSKYTSAGYVGSVFWTGLSSVGYAGSVFRTELASTVS